MTRRADTASAEPIDSPPPPREIRRKSISGCAIGFAQLFILPHMLIGFGALLFVIGEGGLLTFGPSTTARVTTQETHTSSKGNKSYSDKYTYVSGGQTYTDSVNLTASQYSQLTPGATLTVKSFHIGKLGASIVVDPIGPTLKSLGFLLLWAVFWNGVVSIFVWQLYILPLRRRWLAKNGQAIWGSIVGKNTRPLKNGQSYHLRYAYHIASGIHNTSEITVSKREFDRAELPRKALVLYSPAKPTRSILYEFGDYYALDAYGRDIKLNA